MAACKFCGEEMEWGCLGGQYIPLEPIATHADLDRRYKDENGILRADHRDRHGGGAVEIKRLPKRITAQRAEAQQPSRAPVTVGTPWWKRFGRRVAT